MHELRDRDEIEALLKGLGILGTGGGGPPREFGEPVMQADFAAGRYCSLVSPDEVPDDAVVVSGGYLGSVADPIDVNEVLARWEHDFEFGRAVRELGRYLGKKIDYLLATELGGGNTVVIVTAGARLGIPVIDGDMAGRAVPETHMTSMSICGARLTPLAMIDLENNVVFVDRCGDLFADQLGRFLVTRTHGMVATVGSPMDGATLKRGVIPGTLSQAIKLGEFAGSLTGEPEERLRRVARFLRGWPLFWGEVTRVESDNTRGHYHAKVFLKGKRSFSGQSFKIIIKNETMVGWRDGKLVCMLPDLLLMMDPVTLEGVMSASITDGTEMLVVGARSHERMRAALRTPAGQVAFSSERYYEDIPYRPIEELMKDA
ncbi:MAG: DUF917 domain-containing protein [Thermoleophilia bacterium]|nr:DUF917 domain-containing protein [Thermoleophilia bacterium]